MKDYDRLKLQNRCNWCCCKRTQNKWASSLLKDITGKRFPEIKYWKGKLAPPKLILNSQPWDFKDGLRRYYEHPSQKSNQVIRDGCIINWVQFPWETFMAKYQWSKSRGFQGQKDDVEILFLARYFPQIKKNNISNMRECKKNRKNNSWLHSNIRAVEIMKN